MSFLLDPVVFFGLLAGLCAASVMTILAVSRQQQKGAVEQKVAREKLRLSLSEAHTAAQNIEKEYQEKLTRMESELKLKDESQRNSLLQEGRLREENQSLKSSLGNFQKQCNDAESLLQKEKDAVAELSQKSRELELEMSHLRQELALKTQMYEGLRSQYDELEKSAGRTMAPPYHEKKAQSAFSDTLKDILKPPDADNPSLPPQK